LGRTAKLAGETGRWGFWITMKRLLPIVCALCASVISTSAEAQSEAQSKTDTCAAYARNAAASNPTSTGPARDTGLPSRACPDDGAGIGAYGPPRRSA